jgi:hypothetical protein
VTSKADYEARRNALYDIVEEGNPMTVRQVFYRATVLGLVEKSERGYTNIGWDLTVMRKAGTMPYDWIVDGTRHAHRPKTFCNPAEALRNAASPLLTTNLARPD